jgi:glycosyltransferase involved in cell wall biosynthesis
MNMNPKKNASLSVIIPALNEQQNIEAAITTVSEVAKAYFDDWEILVFDDGSTDNTGTLADALAGKDTRVKVLHHKTPQNLGGCYKEGLALATKDYVIMIPGDNECGIDVMEKVFSLAGKADMIIPYTNNSHVRPLGRRLLSDAFVSLMNRISGYHLKYYNGAVLHRTELVRDCGINTDGFGYQAEALVKLLRQGCTFEEVGTEITYRPHGKSKALRIKNILAVSRFIANLTIETRLGPKSSSPRVNKKAA